MHHSLLRSDEINSTVAAPSGPTAVTPHSLWFHMPFRLDDWLLLSQHSPVSAGARAFGTGHVWAVRRGEFDEEYVVRLSIRFPD